jgi:hypothetical protein
MFICASLLHAFAEIEQEHPHLPLAEDPTEVGRIATLRDRSGRSRPRYRACHGERPQRFVSPLTNRRAKGSDVLLA